MIIRNASVYSPEHLFRRGSLVIRDGRITVNTAADPSVPEDTLCPLPEEEVI